MSVQNEITRIQNARNTLRQKAVALGVGLTTDNLTQLATKYNGISDRGTPNAEVKEGESYTIAPGYYHGGVVQGVSGGGSYNLQAKTVTPTKSEQSVVSDAGYYGLSGVTVNPIPDMFQDVSDVTAAAGDVLANKIIVASDGSVVAGTMPDNGSWSDQLTVQDIYHDNAHLIPKGYHDGTGMVYAPSFGELTPVDSGKTAVGDAQMLSGYQGWVNAGKVVGTMPDNGAATLTMTGLGTVAGDTVVKIPAGYHDGNGTVSLTSDIENALAAI